MGHFAGLPPARPMSALEILRETVRVLRSDPSAFLFVLGALLCPVSIALLLSSALLDAPLAAPIARRLALLASASGLPLSRTILQLSHHLAGTLVSAAASFPLLLTLFLAARASVAYSVACAYASKPALPADLLAAFRRVWRRILATYLCACVIVAFSIALFLALLFLVCTAVSFLGYPPEIVVYPALFVVLAFSVFYAHAIVICNLASVISVLEETSGWLALHRSVWLIRGQTQAGLLIFLGSAIGLAFVEGLFEHRVKTLSYGDGSSRLWEGPLLVLMYSFVTLIDSMMSAVFYFTCRSLSMEFFDGDDGDPLVDAEKAPELPADDAE